MTLGALFLYALGLYVAAGLVSGVAFVAAGASQVLPGHPRFTPGARLLLLPAAAALWPYVLVRWARARRQAPGRAP